MATMLRTTALAAGPRPTLDLNGVWEFRMDPKDEGVAQGWFSADAAYPDKIKVPGNWQAQGFGPARNHLRNDYQGKAWYRRSVQVPANWQGKRVWIHMDGVTALGDVYVNGLRTGTVEHYLTPYEFDITDAARFGAVNTIACRVDSVSGSHDPHRDAVVRPGPVGMFNYWAHWGGLYRPVWLEARTDPYIDTLNITPHLASRSAAVEVCLKRAVCGNAWDGRLRVTVAAAGGGAGGDAEATVRFRDGESVSEPVRLDVKLRRVHPWTPEDPFLYGVQAVLSHGGAAVDEKRDRFGMREITTGPGGALLLNGRPYFIRGLGDDYVEPITGTLVPDKAVYAERIKQCKRYGFNGFRYLGHTPSKEVFDAADEVGFLILAEAAAYWNTWPRQSEVIPLYKKMVPQIIREHRNHPSWYAWSAGNECAATPEWMEYVRYAHETFKSTDPTRLFIASEGTGIFPTDIVTLAAQFGDSDASAKPAQPFRGDISEVAYFRTCLPTAEMARLAGTGPELRALVRAMRPSGYWALNDRPGARAADLSGHGRHGAYSPTMPAGSFGAQGPVPVQASVGAVRFGEATPGIDLRRAAPEAFARGNDPFSLSLWVRPSGFAKGDFGTPFSCGAASGGSGFLLSMDGEEGTGKLLVGQWMMNVARSAASLRAGQWNHIGVTYDGAQLTLAINGAAETPTRVHFMVDPVDGRIGALVTEPSAAQSTKDKPHIWHEFNNVYAGSLPELSILPKYTGVVVDNDCVAVHIRQIADYGLTDRYPAIRKASLDYFGMYLKDAYEAARRSPTLDGYNYWLMTDLPGGVEGDPPCLGLLNMFYEPEKFPDPEPFSRFNRETVLLISAASSDRALEAGKTKQIGIIVSHYGAAPIAGGKLSWSLRRASHVVASGTIDHIDVAVGKVKEVAKVALAPGSEGGAAKLTLDVRLDAPSCTQANSWDFWVFPATKPGPARTGVANLIGEAAIGARYGAQASTLSGTTRLAVADRVSPALLDYIAGGGTAVLLAEEGVMARTIPTPYWPQGLRSIGTMVEDHPAVRGFPGDGYCALQYIRLFGAEVAAVDLTTSNGIERSRLAPVVWALKADFDPASAAPWPDPRNRTKLYRCGLVTEGRIGQGKLLVCSLRVLAGIRNGLPEAGYLLDCLVDGALSGAFAPQTAPMSASEAREVFMVQ